MNYDGLNVTKNDIIIWSQSGPISNDYSAGALIGLRNILLDQKDNSTYIASIIIGTETVKFNLLNNQEYTMILTDYILDSAKEDDIINRKIIDYPMGSSLGWWIQKSVGEYYLYLFATLGLIQGFVDICDFFNVDFRDYILGSPFTYDQDSKTFINYYIDGYDVEPIPIPDENAPVGPFYTGVYESSSLDYEP